MCKAEENQRELVRIVQVGEEPLFERKGRGGMAVLFPTDVSCSIMLFGLLSRGVTGERFLAEGMMRASQDLQKVSRVSWPNLSSSGRPLKRAISGEGSAARSVCDIIC